MSSGGMYVNGMFSGVDYTFLPVDKNVGSQAYFEERCLLVKNFINGVVNANGVDSVVNLTYCPQKYFAVAQDNPRQHTVEVTIPNKLGDYNPVNKKLLTYPYMFLNVDTLSSEQIFRYENFNQKHLVGTGDEALWAVNFKNLGFLSANPTILSIPNNYEMVNQTGDNPMYGVTLSGFPHCAMNIDSYRAYIANGSYLNDFLSVQGNMATTMIDIGAMAGAGPLAALDMDATAGAINRDISRVVQSAQTINNMVHALNKPDTIKGEQQGSAHVANRTLNFYYKKMCIKQSYAEKIDDFFTRYGYAQGKLKVPYRHSRSVFTYTKTVDCTIEGGCPADSAKKIASIFNKGITFWANPYMVGQYKSNVDNVPLGDQAS